MVDYLTRCNNFKKRFHISYEDMMKIMLEYANSGEEKACSYFTNKYRLTNYAFYKIRDFSIICNMVDYNTCLQIRDKASQNKHEGSHSSLKHFDELMKKREAFLEESFSKNEIRDIAYKYADGNSVDTISNVYEVCSGAIKKLLAIGITESIIPSEVVESIRIRLQKEGKNLEVFSRLEKARENKKQEILAPLKEEKMVLEYQILSYKDYFFEDENIPDFEFLENRLNEVKEKISALEAE